MHESAVIGIICLKQFVMRLDVVSTYDYAIDYLKLVCVLTLVILNTFLFCYI